MKKIVLAVTASLVLTMGTSKLITTRLNTNLPNSAVSNILTSENQNLQQVPSQNITESPVEALKEIEGLIETEDIKPAEEKPVEIITSANENSSDSMKNSTSSSIQEKNTTVAKSDNKPTQSLSRGVAPSVPNENKNNSNISNKSSESKYGELLDWWKQVKTLIPTNSTIQVTDLSTGKSFNIKRTFGSNHIDGEALTVSDTNTIKSIWGGFSWTRRPVVVTYNERKIAASMTAMPHAGVDSAPALASVNNRSDGYGRGENLDAIKNNGMDGVIDIHFYNSTRHKDNKPDPQHQAAIQKANGK